MSSRFEFAQALVERICDHSASAPFGSVLFGSTARETDHPASDIDLLFVTWDDCLQQAKRRIRDIVQSSSNTLRVSASCESDVRLRHFIAVGDPFVRSVIGTGRILRDEHETLAALKAQCSDPSTLPSTATAIDYLRTKAVTHHHRLHDHLRGLLGDLQLSLMARCQALALSRLGEVSTATYFELGDWAVLEQALEACEIPATTRADVHALIEAQKQSPTDGPLGDFYKRFSDAAEALERARDCASGGGGADRG